MRKMFLRALVSALIIFALIFSYSVSVLALDDKYTIDELDMSIKIPKQYMVITRTLERDDEVFSELKLDYDETMTAFLAANIYLQAISDDSVLKITLTETSDENSKAINNYSELSESERKQVLEALIESGSCTSGVEIKHNGNIYFDLSLTQQSGESSIFCYQCHTVINGMNINLTLHKDNEKLTADEIKIITDIANTVSFDKIVLKSGPSFEWWRFLLWIVILVAIALLAKYFYSRYNQYRYKNSKIRRERKNSELEDLSDEDLLLNAQSQYTKESGNLHTLLSELGLDKNSEEEISFDELLGYDTTDYHERADIEVDNFDIKVRSKDKRKGVSYFEDDGKDINSSSKVVNRSDKDVNSSSKVVNRSKRIDKDINTNGDYFDEFFHEETEHRPLYKRSLSSVSLYFQIIVRRVKEFFSSLFSADKKGGKNRRK